MFLAQEQVNNNKRFLHFQFELSLQISCPEESAIEFPLLAVVSVCLRTNYLHQDL
jgi:hypothetical protein